MDGECCLVLFINLIRFSQKCTFRQGWSLCVLYLLAGSKVTKVKMKDKELLGIGEGRGGRRGPENVWGSAATGALCAVATCIWPAHRSLFTVENKVHQYVPVLLMNQIIIHWTDGLCCFHGDETFRYVCQ